MAVQGPYQSSNRGDYEADGDYHEDGVMYRNTDDRRKGKKYGQDAESGNRGDG
jgi:hypothetical protein